jgi:hypothetical protein
VVELNGSRWKAGQLGCKHSTVRIDNEVRASDVYTEDTNAKYNFVNTNQLNQSAVNSTTNVNAYHVGSNANVSSSAVGNTAQVVH